MPSLPNPDEFPYYAQDEDLPECVPACVAMIFEYLGIDLDPAALKHELGYDPQTGTEFSNISDLPGVRAIRVGGLDEVEDHLSAAVPAPVIADLLVLDDEVLGYELAPVCPFHAVVVVGLDTEYVTFSDPLSHALRSTELHSQCSRSAFERAWQRGFALRLL